jgi:hypothetical protein
MEQKIYIKVYNIHLPYYTSKFITHAVYHSTLHNTEIWKKVIKQTKNRTVLPSVDGFGGLVVSMLASGSRVRGFDPDRSRCEKILSMPSFGGEVK